MRWARWFVVWAMMFACCGRSREAHGAAARLSDELTPDARHWQPYFNKGNWSASDRALTSTSKVENTARLVKMPPTTDVVIQAEVRLAGSGRRNVGLVLRAQDDRTCLVVRYYDRHDTLEVLRYDKGRVKQIPCGVGRLRIRPGRWYRFKAAAVEEMVLGKLWPAGTAEPAWQLRHRTTERRPGRVGLIVQDASRVAFRNVRILSGTRIDALQRRVAGEREAHRMQLRQTITMALKPTPFVHRTAEGPARRIDLRTVARDKPEPVDGTLSIRFGDTSQTRGVKASDFVDGAYPLLVPEPSAPAELHVTFETSLPKRLECRCAIAPARKWTFYMTPHTHYDIGYTHPQDEVIERLSRDMDTAQQYCDQTADWPVESRYRWTVEVSGLVKNYIERHSPEQVARLMALARQGRIEICGYYLNMPTELVGHEELIRCLYYAEALRRRYNVSIDTAMIDDVPGYAWALPQLFREAGIERVSFRANSIRGQFLWYRPKAVPRPFYWEGPDGSRLFVWYTDSYREGNFFREPGLHEGAFEAVIRRNEDAGCRVDDIQLRMGGDNLPPDLDTSKNARAWNAKYIWPKVVVATNREFLEVLEKRYSPRCEVHRGDIPSWWAEGPASSALETGMNRLVHDRLVAAEALWTVLWLDRPGTTYPRQAIDRAYDKMIHFDEHTWGASGSVSEPRSENTLGQWKWKSANAYEAKRLTDELHHRALEQLSESVPAAGAHSIAVWNALAWPRTDVVELPLADTPFNGATGISVVDTRTKKRLPAQICRDGKSAVFIARDVPPLGYVCYSIESTGPEKADTVRPAGGTLENASYRLTVSPEAGGLVSWFDKRLKRELLDRDADYRGNQAIYETPIGGRDAINKKRPVRFKRVAARDGRWGPRVEGPVFSELTIEASLPSCPRIKQRVRLYNDLELVDVVNAVTKEEVYEPEGVYFAFPFDVPSPEIRFQIADAIMRPGKDQLTYSCQDFYSIQHWVDVCGDGFGVVLAPLEAPVVVASDLNVYKWADQIAFDTGHLYSLVMNNYWYTNFKAGQGGTLTFRYRLTSYARAHDSVRTTRFAWQPFYPLEPVWLTAGQRAGQCLHRSLLEIEGDPVVVSCLKLAETGDALIVRLLEQRGKPSRCTLKFNLPGGRQIDRACTAAPVETPRDALTVSDNAVAVQLRPNGIATIGVVPATP